MSNQPKEMSMQEHNFNEIVKVCNHLGILSISIEYGGAGDDGGVEEIEIEPADTCPDKSAVMVMQKQYRYHPPTEGSGGSTATIEESEIALDQALELFFCHSFEKYGIDFNNHGCQGSLVIDVQEREVVVENQINFTMTQKF